MKTLSTLISADPVNGFARRATVCTNMHNKGFEWNPGQSIETTLRIDFLNEQLEVLNLQRMPSYFVTLRADNSARVDAQGNIVPQWITPPDDRILFTPGVENPAWTTAIGELDFWEAIADNDVNIFNLILQSIFVADSRGRFDH